MIPHEDRLVVVEWEDAWADASWHDVLEGHEDAQKPVIAYSVGWVVQETEEAIVLSSAVVADGLGGLMRIPAGMVRTVRYVKDAGPA